MERGARPASHAHLVLRLALRRCLTQAEECGHAAVVACRRDSTQMQSTRVVQWWRLRDGSGGAYAYMQQGRQPLHARISTSPSPAQGPSQAAQTIASSRLGSARAVLPVRPTSPIARSAAAPCAATAAAWSGAAIADNPHLSEEGADLASKDFWWRRLV